MTILEELQAAHKARQAKFFPSKPIKTLAEIAERRRLEEESKRQEEERAKWAEWIERQRKNPMPVYLPKVAAKMIDESLRTIPDIPKGYENIEWIERQIIQPRKPLAPTMELAARLVCKHFNLTKADLHSHRRHPTQALARHVVFYLTKTFTTHSYPAIGRVFNRDHTTVLHGVRRIAALIEADPAMRQTIEILTEKIKRETE